MDGGDVAVALAAGEEGAKAAEGVIVLDKPVADGRAGMGGGLLEAGG